MRLFVILGCAYVVTSCAGPNYQNPLEIVRMGEELFIVGGENCSTYKLDDPGKLTCYYPKGKVAGTRSPIPAGSLPEVQRLVGSNNIRVDNENAQAQARYQASKEAFFSSLEQLNQSSGQWRQESLAAAQQANSNLVQPASKTQPPKAITFTQSGGSIIGSNGITYRKVGSSIVGSDGTYCQIVGQHLICR